MIRLNSPQALLNDYPRGATKDEPQIVVLFYEKAVGTVSFSRLMASKIDISMTQAGDLSSRHIPGPYQQFSFQH